MTGAEPRQLSAGAPDGPLVVLAHGLEDGWASWRPVAEHLDPAWRVWALDLPWRAGNDYRWRNRAGAADWLATALDALGEPADAVVAHSFGANAVLELMAAGDKRVGSSVVLMCPLFRLPDSPVTWTMFDRARYSFEANVRDGVRARLGPRLDVIGPEMLEAITAKAVDRVGLVGMLTVFDRFIASADLDLEPGGPTAMVLVGGDDPTLSVAAAEALAAHIDAAVLTVDEGFDHHCHIRQPAAVARHVVDFVHTQIPPRQSIPMGRPQ